MRFRKHEDHPRGCGENAFGLSQALSLSGSPPRMRGKPKSWSKKKRAERITPADAGKTSDRFRAASPTRDHPRGCGENFGGWEGLSLSTGSPPRMRGKQTELVV